MKLDAQTFAEWDVDYVKLDGCYANISDMATGYPEFGRLLNETGRPMVYSCSWPAYQEEAGEIRLPKIIYIMASEVLIVVFKYCIWQQFLRKL